VSRQQESPFSDLVSHRLYGAGGSVHIRGAHVARRVRPGLARRVTRGSGLRFSTSSAFRNSIAELYLINIDQVFSHIDIILRIHLYTNIYTYTCISDARYIYSYRVHIKERVWGFILIVDLCTCACTAHPGPFK